VWSGLDQADWPFKEHLIIWRSQPWFNTPWACSSQSNSEHQGIYKYEPHYII